MLRHNDADPGRTSIQLVTENFRATGSVLKEKPSKRPRSARISNDGKL